MKRWIKSVTPPFAWGVLRGIRRDWFTRYARDAYSQEGEDLILERLFYCKPTGFYVDVGAHHPKRYSNTYRLYRRGWKGINVDANPGSMSPFRLLRPRDINIEAAVGSTSEDLIFYVFNDPALNTLDQNLALQRVASGGGRSSIVQEVRVATVPLSSILERHLLPGARIDLLTIDVEGFDYAVLQSNDWEKYSPDFVLVECLNALTFDFLTVDEVMLDPVALFLSDRGYSIIAKTVSTVVFKLNSAKPC